jgi:plasmid stability protein
MVMINIPDDIAQELKARAERENRSLEDVVVLMLSEQVSVQPETSSVEEWVDPFDAIDGILDYDITDMSTTVKETMSEYHKNKKWKSDDL